MTLADVERHVTLLLGDILGFPSPPSDPGTDGDEERVSGSWSAGEMGAWLKSYFVAKDELETRLSHLQPMVPRETVRGKFLCC